MPILKKLFSFPAALASLLVLLAVLTVRDRLDDPDLWWHLKMGQLIAVTHSIPAADSFSYTANHQPLVPQEWLAELSIFAAYRIGGYSGLMGWLCLLTAALLVAGYALCWLYSGNAKVAFLGALFICFFSSTGLAIRPQMISYLLLIAELAIIHAARTRNARWCFALPPLFLLWINCHASFILGILVAAIYLASSFACFRAGSLAASRWSTRSRTLFTAALALSIAVLPINPAGLRQILYPFDNLLHMPLMLASVQEWAPLQFNQPHGIALAAVLLGSLLLTLVRHSQRFPQLFLDELLLMLLGAWLAADHLRLLYVFGILAAPVLTRQLAPFWENYQPANDRIWPNELLIAAALSIAFLAFPSPRNLQSQVEAQSPVKAVQFIQANRLAGPILNDYQFGGYLIWAAPQLPVMIDGRADVYEWSGFLPKFASWATLTADPNSLLDAYRVNLCLLRAQAPMARVLPLLPGWKQTYSDSNSIIFVRSTARFSDR